LGLRLFSSMKLGCISSMPIQRAVCECCRRTETRQVSACHEAILETTTDFGDLFGQA
jgi:hypothetical protein